MPPHASDHSFAEKELFEGFYLEPSNGLAHPSSIQLWNQSNKGNGHWRRFLSTGDVFSPAPGISAKPIEITPFEEIKNTSLTKVRRWLSGVFGKEDLPNSLITPTGLEVVENGIVDGVSRSRRKALLAWAESSNVELTNELFDPFFQKIEEIQYIGPQAAVVFGHFHDKTTLSMPNIDKKRANTVSVNLGKFDTMNYTLSATEVHPRDRIGKIEHGLVNFEQLLLCKLKEQQSERPSLSTALQNPFHFVRGNFANPLKYYGDAEARAQSEGLSIQDLLLGMPEPFFFTYAFNENFRVDYGFMGYAPLLRTFVLNDFSSDNVFDLVAFMHEAVHCMHAAAQRKRDLQGQINFGSMSGNIKRVVIQEEFDAYALELEALNLILDNKMLIASRAGSKLKPEEILVQLNLRPEQIEPLRLLCHLSSIYFKESSLQNYSQEYMSRIAGLELSYGFDLYTPNYQLIAKNPNS